MAQKLYVTLDELKQFGACKPRLNKLMKRIEFDKAEEVRIPIELILDVNGPWDAMWAITRLRWDGGFVGCDQCIISQKEYRSLAGEHCPDWRSPFGSKAMVKAYTRRVRELIKGVKR